jgi:hypothetical protein
MGRLPSPLGVDALDAARRLDLDCTDLTRRATSLGADGDGLFPVAVARSHLQGLNDRCPDDLEVLVALGLVSVVAGRLGTRRRWSPPDDDNE